MKKIIFSAVVLFGTLQVAQAQQTNTEFNRWTIELGTGQSIGVKPSYSPGFNAVNPNSTFKGISFNHFNAGARYMFNPTFGVKLGFGYDNLQNTSGSGSADFEVQNLRASFQGVVNAMRLFNSVDELGRFGLLLHGGVNVSQLTPKMGPNENNEEYNGGFVVGFTPQFRITKTIAITSDFSLFGNFRQHYNWNGASVSNDHLTSIMVNASLGLSISLGGNKFHGDWAPIVDKYAEEFAALEQRVGEVESMLVDSDQDGVPDYLDQEPNSVAGVAVDSRGRMIDLNNNGVPDELERYLEKNYATKESAQGASSDQVIRDLINKGYITTYFDFDKTKPTNVSTEGIDFMLVYLRNNPSATIDIIGHADEIGDSKYNDNLAKKRAESVKAILVKAGIDASRMNTISSGEDKSVDPSSAGARKLVRRVTFRIK